MPGPPFVSTFACSTRFAKVSFDERVDCALCNVGHAMPRLRALNIRAEMERIAKALIIIDVTTLAPFGPEFGWKSCGFSKGKSAQWFHTFVGIKFNQHMD